jgi:hypothetical protein
MTRLYALFLPAVLLVPASLPTTSTPGTPLVKRALAAAPAICQDGGTQTEERSVEAFNALRVGGPFRISLVIGNETKLQLKGTAEQLRYVEVSQQGGSLHIRLRDGMEGFAFRRRIEINLTTPHLTDLRLSGACELSSEGTVKEDKLALDLSGASSARMEMDLQTLDIQTSGASTLYLSGTSKNFSCDMSGAGTLRAYDLEAENVRLQLSGASVANIYARNEISVSSSGASSVRYKGNASVKNFTNSGSSSIKKVD